jgi:hypothetical protein
LLVAHRGKADRASDPRDQARGDCAKSGYSGTRTGKAWRDDCGFFDGFGASPHRETSMFQNMSARRRPSLALVLFWCALTVAWWVGLCLYAGKPIWFW